MGFFISQVKRQKKLQKKYKKNLEIKKKQLILQTQKGKKENNSISRIE